MVALRRALPKLPPEVRADAERVLAYHGEIDGRFRMLTYQKLAAKRIRIHGDYHLGQVLYTNRDFVIIDFEGEPVRPLSERRFKRSALRDVAGMLRSFDYAAHAKLYDIGAGARVRPEDMPFVNLWAEFWRSWVSATFLGAYLDAALPGNFLPPDPDNLALLLDAYLLNKAVYEVGYEMNSRPDWLPIPARGILRLLGHSS
jgi:maltose alpha-D-glucosyltransferase/alpha-amylase